MNQTHRAHGVRIGQLLVEIRDLAGQQQALINDGAGRQRRNIEEALVGDRRSLDLVFGALADNVELPLQFVLGNAKGAPNENLLYIRLRRAAHPADRVHVHRRVAPAQNLQIFFPRDPFQDALGLQPLPRLHGQKHHAHAVFAWRRQRKPEPAALARKELVRDLNQNARAVARLRIAAAGPAVAKIDQNLQTLQNDVVRLLALNVDDKADATGVVLVLGVV